MEAGSAATSSITTVWSTKGGVGVSSVAALLAIANVELGYDTILVDLCGDQPAVLGLDDAAATPGVGEWCASAARSPQALTRIQREVRSRLWFVARGETAVAVAAAKDLVSALRASPCRIVVDCGRLDQAESQIDVAAAGDRRLQVVRACFMTLRRATPVPVNPTGVVLVHEPGRVLGLADVESAVAAPVVARVTLDRSVARSIDAGLMTSRPPRSLVRTLAKVVAGE